ncbi:hypothetical protein D9623_33910 (plasmid) [Azospirillum brasilense]|uniref:Uncharacterized protein n=1 Tax=Azospirillum brasilense TaxID=192 RepID=A0A4D8QTP6_AZOBR|nr:MULTISPECIES: hypothetical protein [Azospirillum]YP_001686920.1 hypothetical protein APCd_gp79 [Azospirillum phage Cd]MDW7555439.1 hypothetical protein [Azospirillum brasilense]MDW7595153.1 hypothetical protein [Azospirillum brasilense]MDW7630306.1 hypothetical protein [Azospirillum brasilense]MDX5949674.1 hypothetical protein [Azospirillum brasilense]OPH16811.1 hypothetical protein FE89_02295 [Azospirillum brasilense]
MSEPEYTKGKRIIDGAANNVVRADDPEDAEPWVLAEFDAHCGHSLEEPKGNARLAKASDNAVLELAEHLGCNAVLLAERLEGGGLVRLVEAAQRYVGTVNALTRGHPDEAQSSDEARVALSGQIAATKDIAAALSLLTTPAPL